MPKSIIIILVLLGMSSCSLLKDRNANNTLRVLHYNIFELDSAKISSVSGNPDSQLLNVKKILAPYDFHLLSVNEIQYDWPGVPYPSFKTQGANLSTFTQWLRPDKGWDFHFAKANTGEKAKKIAAKSYATSDDRGARFYADPNNYGLFPGQYSTGLASRYPVKKKIVLADLPWREFNPKASLHKYRNGAKQKLPKDIALFDKVFMDTVIEVNHKLVHVITFHTVPAFHFGNKRSPNYQRNLDQLRFLEWYLTGKSDIPTKDSYAGIKPLNKSDIFIAMGDWNTDINNKKNPGSQVLLRFQQTGRLFPSHSPTWESPGYNPDRMSMRLDYIFYSEDLKIHNARVLKPEENRVLLGCDKKSLLHANAGKEDKAREIVSYKNKRDETCRVSINKAFKRVKDASDHFPLWVEFKFK